MKPGPSLACKLFIAQVDIQAPPKPALEWLGDMVLSEGWTSSAVEALEVAENWERGFLNYLVREYNYFNRLGRFVPFAFNSSSHYMLQGSAFIEPSDTPAVKEQKARRSQMDKYIAALKALNPKEFECLCAGVLDALGGSDSQITRFSGDHGIDFHCRLRVDSLTSVPGVIPTWTKQLSIWMIGQAKHYLKGKVQTPDVRELVGSIVLAQGGAYVRKTSFPNLSLRACDPSFYLFFTTGRLSSDSWALLESSGVIGMDGAMLAAFLADRQIGCVSSGFNAAEFAKWLRDFN